MAAGFGSEFEIYEELVAPAFQSATNALSVSFANAEVSLIAATVAPQTVDGLVSVLGEPMLRAVVFYEGQSELEECPCLLAISVEDAKTAALLMMDAADQEPPEELEEFHRSAVEELLRMVAEAVAQDVSARAGKQITSAVRNTEVLTLSDEADALEDLSGGGPVGLVTVNYICGDKVLAFSQIISSDFARHMTALVSGEAPGAVAAEEPEPEPEPSQPTASASPSPLSGGALGDAAVSQAEVEAILAGLSPSEAGIERPAAPPLKQIQPRPTAPAAPTAPARPSRASEARPVEFDDLEREGGLPPELDNFPLIANIPIQLSVELGRTHRTIKEIMEFGTGYTIRLDRAADEPVDICAGGRTIARGEVVVIDENFAVRIRQILRPIGDWIKPEGSE